MSDFLMTSWDGAGATPPLMSVARALVERGHRVRVLADVVLRPDVEATGAEHLSWTRAPQRTVRRGEGHFVRDWEPQDPADAFGRMRDRLAVGPAKRFAADVCEEIERRPPAAVLTELFLFGPLVAAEAAGVPAIVLNPTINVVPAPGVPPFGYGFMPPRTPEEEALH
ncbi:MAG: glycosyltransferase, partial [Actinomycetota bacterium]|nr:glycosyltransferase [Actinomycetota bacterium]